MIEDFHGVLSADVAGTSQIDIANRRPHPIHLARTQYHLRRSKRSPHIFVREANQGHTIGESRAAASAPARANDRTVQVGLHRRHRTALRIGMKVPQRRRKAGDIGLV